MDKKIKILALCDSPTVATGFAQVSRNVLNGLHATGRYEIDVIGINHHGDAYDRTKFPYNIYPAMPQGWADMYGRDRIMNALSGGQAQYGLVPPWDIVFTIQDPFIIEGLGVRMPFAEQLRVISEMWKRTVSMENWFKWVGYFPIDAAIKENWVTRSIMLPQYPVAYCEWGKQQILKYDRDDLKVPFNLTVKDSNEVIKGELPVSSIKDRIKVIHHGVDLKSFYPLPEDEIKKFRKEYFGGHVKDDTFLVVNISRNQPRKDISRTIAAFAEFKKKVPNSYLYLHMKANDAGGSVDEMARNFGLRPVIDYTVPENFAPGTGFSIEIVNKIYNAANACMTTTLGEGWGFITTEAMATKTPILAPNITSMLDIFDSYDYDGDTEKLGTSPKLRGIPVKAGSTSSEWVCLGLEDNERVRPLTNVDDLVEKLMWVYLNEKGKVRDIVERAYTWVQSLAWDKIVSQWVSVIDEAYSDLEKERKLGEAIDKAGRNDPCPCGSGKKFKVCHGVKTNDKFEDWTKKNLGTQD